MLTGLAHTAVCVPDVEEAVRWYSEVLGLQVLSPPYTMQGAQIEQDMGELVPPPVVVTAAIVGFGKDDRVIELIEYPAAGVDAAGPNDPSVTRVGLTHVGLVCDDLACDSVRARESEASYSSREVLADVAGLKTTWCHDPWGTVIILMEKRDAARPYWGQMPAPRDPQPRE